MPPWFRLFQDACLMSDLFWLSDEKMVRLEPFFPKSYAKPRVDDRRVVSSIISISYNALRWIDVPAECSLVKNVYKHWKQWRDIDGFAHMVLSLSDTYADPFTLMIDATYLQCHRTASSFRLKKGEDACSDEPKAG